MPRIYPICFLPLPIDGSKSRLYACCSTLVCDGCEHANKLRELNKKLHPQCPFCRHPAPKTQAEADKNKMKRVAANDPFALRQMGSRSFHEGDNKSAFEYFSKAADLGNVDAHYCLSIAYDKGNGVEKDEKKQTYHLEEGAIGGDPNARHNLGVIDWNNGRRERAVKHFIIAAKLGNDISLKMVKNSYANGIVSKEEFAATLREYQATVEATKSPQRETAADYRRMTNSQNHHHGK